jgi:hypothetical protein
MIRLLYKMTFPILILLSISVAAGKPGWSGLEDRSSSENATGFKAISFDLPDTLYVNNQIGADSLDGHAQTTAGGHGPKGTISGAINAASNGSMISIAKTALVYDVMNTGLKSLTFTSVGGSPSVSAITIAAATTFLDSISLTKSGTLTLSSGVLTNASNLTIADSATIIRGQGSLSAAPVFAGSTNVTYASSQVTGYEVPPSGKSLLNLTITNDATLTLSQTTSVGGILRLSSTGGLDLNGQRIALGSDLIVDIGSFKNSGALATIAFVGTLPQMFAAMPSGLSFPSNGGPIDIEINMGAPTEDQRLVSISRGNVTMGKTVPPGKVHFIRGFINTGTYTWTLIQSQLAGWPDDGFARDNGTGHFIGNVRKNITPGVSASVDRSIVTFPVGLMPPSSAYRPLRLYFNADPGVPMNITVNHLNHSPSGVSGFPIAAGNLKLTRYSDFYWSLKSDYLLNPNFRFDMDVQVDEYPNYIHDQVGNVRFVRRDSGSADNPWGVVKTLTTGNVQYGNYVQPPNAIVVRVIEQTGGITTQGSLFALAESDRPPYFTAALGNMTKNEGDTLTFVYSAADPDVNDKVILQKITPPEATFDTLSGRFNWIIGYDIANSSAPMATRVITIRATDTYGPLGKDTVATITVLNVNRKPVFAGLGSAKMPNSTVKNGDTLQFRYVAIDPDADPLSYLGLGLPIGASLSPDGYFTWVPQLPQAGFNYLFTVVVTDNGGLSDTTRALVTVRRSQAPLAVTMDTTNVNPTSATLHGTFNPNGLQTIAYFQYGTNVSFAQSDSTSPQVFGPDTLLHSLQANLSGLKPNKAYYFRIIGKNSDGTGFGNIKSFSTGGIIASKIVQIAGDGQTKSIKTTLNSFVVQVASSNGLPVSGVSVTFDMNPSFQPSQSKGYSLSQTTAFSDSNGQASTVLTLGNKVGNYFVLASSPGLLGSPIEFTATATVGPAKELQKNVAGDGQKGFTNAALAKPFEVIVVDDEGNPVKGVSVNLNITMQPAGASGASLSTSSATTGVDGRASTTLKFGNKPGDYQVAASSTGLTGSPATFSATATYGAASIVYKTGRNQTAKINSALPAAFVVQVNDSSGNPVPAVPVTFAVTSTPPNALLYQLTVSNNGITDAFGQAQAVLIVGSKIGRYETTCTPLGWNGNNVLFAADAIAGPPTSFSAKSNLNLGSVVVKSMVSNPLVVAVQDAGGNPAPLANVDFKLTSIPVGSSGAVLTAGSTQTNSDGEATTTFTVGNRVGKYEVTASCREIAGSNAVFISTATAGPAKTMIKLSGDNQSALIKSMLKDPFVTRVEDAYGNPISQVPMSFITSSKPAAAIGDSLFSSNLVTDDSGKASSKLKFGNRAGSYSVTASSSALSGTTAVFNARASYAADFNADGKIDAQDMIQLLQYQKQRDQTGDIGPAVGAVPELMPAKDGKVDFEDLMVFAQMWNWSLDHPNGRLVDVLNSPPMNDARITQESTLGLKANDLLVIPLLDRRFIEGASAISVYVKYDPQKLTLEAIDRPTSENLFVLVRIESRLGVAVIDIALSSPSPDVDLSLVEKLSGSFKILGEIHQETIHVATEWYRLTSESPDRDFRDIRLNTQTEVPKTFSLAQNYPNPFNPSTRISYSIPVRSLVQIRVLNTLGQIVDNLISQYQDPGNYSREWKANSASGVYFYQMVAVPVDVRSEPFQQIKKMLLLR